MRIGTANTRGTDMTTKYRITPKRDFGSGPGYWLPNAGNTGTGKYGFVTARMEREVRSRRVDLECEPVD